MDNFKLPKENDQKSVLKTIRLKYKLFEKIELLSKQNNISINRIINECIEFALDHFTDNTPKE
ncbi:MAG: hypothetical protein IKE70_06290 [Bacilli bacterium]|nr:hypothetical protein [Bacilli bacterium]